MIFCNECGGQLDSAGICGDCALPLLNIMADTTAAAHTVENQQTSSRSEPTVSNNNWLVILVVAAIVGVGILIYLTARRNSTDPNELAATSAASSMRTAIANRHLISLTGDDAYTYFDRLKTIDPQNPALANVKEQVLQDLLNIGEELIRRRVNHSGEVSEQDWRIFIRAYEWSRRLQPDQNRVEARYKYALGKLAEAQGRRTDAWQNFSSATQFDPAWAVPQNDLGYWATQDSSSGKQKWLQAIPYYQNAINLMPEWEIPYNNLGTAYFYLGNLDQAEIYYRQAVERNSNWARPHKWLGDICLNRNDLATAMSEYQTAANLYNPATDSLDISYVQRKIAQLRAKGY